ncbi:circadian clock-controlled protein daywake-like isoform X1 [Diorhabda sublineata]|uniref:circadian clock-controlled protein daywake-like isoform X1 n=1 Tax=Diorhabda sublineata TaxID=1163346 RepID=UPI0024E07466|nr:circadian clock-controlled protein daywake-like isoform X1 [Diorhabda sublineata]
MIKDPREIFINCSTHAVQQLFNQIPKGVPEIGLQVLDPLKIPVLNVIQGGRGPVTVNASLDNVTVIGFGNTKILYNSVDPKTYDFYTKLSLPRLRIDGNYELLGKILVIPLRGKGKCWFDAQNLDINVKSDVIMEKHDGFDFFNVTDVHVTFNIGGLKLHMGNLFDGIKALEESTNEYLNANWRPVADSLSPILSKTIEDIMLDILQRVFDNIPANFFLGDLEL